MSHHHHHHHNGFPTDLALVHQDMRQRGVVERENAAEAPAILLGPAEQETGQGDDGWRPRSRTTGRWPTAALAEEERKAAAEDAKVLAATLRGAVAISAVVLNSYIDPKTGALRHTDITARDAAVLLGLALRGRGWLDARVPAQDLTADEPSDIEQFLQAAGPDARMRALGAMRELLEVIESWSQSQAQERWP